MSLKKTCTKPKVSRHESRGFMAGKSEFHGRKLQEAEIRGKWLVKAA